MKNRVFKAVLVAALFFASYQAATAEGAGSLLPKECILSYDQAACKANQTRNVIVKFDGMTNMYTGSLVCWAVTGQGWWDKHFGTRIATVYVPDSLIPETGSIEIEYQWYLSPRGDIGNSSRYKFRPECNSTNHALAVVVINGRSYRANGYLSVKPAVQEISRKTEYQLSGQIKEVENATMAKGKRVRFTLEVSTTDTLGKEANLKVRGRGFEVGLGGSQAHADTRGQSVMLEDTDNGRSLMAPVYQIGDKLLKITYRHILKDGSSYYETETKKLRSGIEVQIIKMEGKGGTYKWPGR